MADSEGTTPFSDEDYNWVMYWAKRGGPDNPEELPRFRALVARLNDTISDDSHQERTAYHEAAHAVVAHALGFEVEHVIIREDHSGAARWTAPINFAPTHEDALRDVVDEATTSAAGYVAEQMKWGRGRGLEEGLLPQVTYKLHKFSDIKSPMPQAVRSALSVTEGLPIMLAAAALVEQQEAAAHDILRANWGTVERLAALLLRQRRVAGTELAAVLSTVSRMTIRPSPV